MCEFPRCCALSEWQAVLFCSQDTKCWLRVINNLIEYCVFTNRFLPTQEWQVSVFCWDDKVFVILSQAKNLLLMIWWDSSVSAFPLNDKRHCVFSEIEYSQPFVVDDVKVNGSVILNVSEESFFLWFDEILRSLRSLWMTNDTAFPLNDKRHCVSSEWHQKKTLSGKKRSRPR